MADQAETHNTRDLGRRPLGFMMAWGLPLIILLSVGFIEFLSPAAEILIVAGAFAWMGVGCVVNAARCGRLHCYFAGPIMLTGAVLILLIGFEVVSLGAVSTAQIIYATAALALSTFALDFIWGAYVKRPPKSKSEA